MVLERLTRKGAAVAGSGAGGFAGGLFNNPGIIILGALVVGFVFFAGDIRKAFGSLGESLGGIGDIQLPDITLPSFEFPTINFPDITFPSFDIEFPDFSDIFGGIDFGGVGEGASDFFSGLQDQFDAFIEGIGGNGGGGLPLPEDVEDIGLIEDPATECPCGSNVIQDIQGDVSQTCIPCPEEEGGFIGPPEPPEQCVDVPLITGGSFNTCTGIVTQPDFVDESIEPPIGDDQPFEPPIDLPEGFEGGGPTFEGGTIFETDDLSCTTLSCVLDRNPGMTASQAADRLAEILGNTGDFDFGTNTGSGFGPGEDQSGGIVTGGATLESEEQKAACITCELFGLNCPLCSGAI